MTSLHVFYNSPTLQFRHVYPQPPSPLPYCQCTEGGGIQNVCVTSRAVTRAYLPIQGTASVVVDIPPRFLQPPSPQTILTCQPAPPTPPCPRRETSHMPSMWETVCTGRSLKETHYDPHGRKTSHMPSMWETVYTSYELKDTTADPHRRETSHMPSMW